jgi:hypothetical protein
MSTGMDKREAGRLGGAASGAARRAMAEQRKADAVIASAAVLAENLDTLASHQRDAFRAVAAKVAGTGGTGTGTGGKDRKRK